MQLARAFTDDMVLQRDMPILLWGQSDSVQTISVRLNGRTIAEEAVDAGPFVFLLPAQPAMEDAVLEVGAVRLCHVDIGEVWVAGGQSNMEFLLKYTEGGEAEATQAADPHLRMYTVGQYSFAGERQLGYKAWEPWDRWLPYAPENAGDFSAVGVYFAKKLRQAGVPVGILSCSWGGTSASAWTERARLAAKTLPGVYMTSISDIGNVFDIHLKVKRPVGERLALLAQKYVYGDGALLADAPEAAGMERQGDAAVIVFANGEGLSIRPEPDTGYNGFAAEEIPAEFLPPVLGGVNGLAVWADGIPLQDAVCRTDGDRLFIRAPELSGAKTVAVQFAETAFYRVNLYNRAGIPAKPFTLTSKGGTHNV